MLSGFCELKNEMSKTNFLTKADFKLWRSCPTKLLYKLKGLPSNADGNSFLKFLANEGERVGRCARRLFCSGILVQELDPIAAFARTWEIMHTHENITLFEPCFIADGLVARPDIVKKQGHKLWLFEAKAASDKEWDRPIEELLVTIHGTIRSHFREYVDDLAFQSAVIQACHPDMRITHQLILPRKEALAGRDEIDYADSGNAVAVSCDQDTCAKRRADSVLRFLPADEAVRIVRDVTSETIKKMQAAVATGHYPKQKLCYRCRNCEYRLGSNRDGFSNCWGKLADPSPHLFDLHQLYQLKAGGNDQSTTLLADRFIKEKKTSLFDIRESDLHGKYIERQRTQLQVTRNGKEWLAAEMQDAIASLSWPLYFLDFETFFSAVPWHEGIKPYEVLPIQWSCHILTHDGKLSHKEWLHTDNNPPQRCFIRSMRNTIGNAGNILIYTKYEKRVLEGCLDYLTRFPTHLHEEVGEIQWLDQLLGSNRWIDQHDWAYKWYYHPDQSMHGGRSSLKVTLPAAWSSNPSLRNHEWFRAYNMDKGEHDPYKTLPLLPIGNNHYGCRDGAEAMSIYQELHRGHGSRHASHFNGLSKLLLEYCKLDTLSQVFLLLHWAECSKANLRFGRPLNTMK